MFQELHTILRFIAENVFKKRWTSRSIDGRQYCISLTQSLTSGVNYKIYFNNFFSSIDILRLLKEKKFLAVATIRKNRLKDASKKVLNENDLKKVGRGSSDYVVDVNSGICIVRWYGNNIVQFISNYIGNEPGTPANRWSKRIKNLWLLINPR